MITYVLSTEIVKKIRHQITDTLMTDFSFFIQFIGGAGKGSRTPNYSLEGCRFTAKLYPHMKLKWRALRDSNSRPFDS